mmetsp:Transcript_86907/g.221315  ORF Transcript_86907/g.221315 Transcript_86907/m.221315 type:complete len:161 (-) Transcript_86907:40-522(-)
MPPSTAVVTFFLLLLAGAAVPHCDAEARPGLSALQTAYSMRRGDIMSMKTASGASKMTAAEARKAMLLRARHLEAHSAKQDRRLAVLREELLGEGPSTEAAKNRAASAPLAERLAALEESMADRTTEADALLARTRSAVESRREKLQAATNCESSRPSCV